MISYADALAAVLARAPVLPPERVETAGALGRALAEDVTAPRDLPWRDTSLMDGYAVRAADAREGAALRVAMTLPPGSRPERALSAGEAARIMTGGPLPDGADAVVMQEYARAEGAEVVLARAARPGEHVRRRGDEARAGEVLLPRGTELGPAEIALLIAAGRAQVLCGGRPRVAIGTSGDELDESGEPAEGRTIDSNTPTLALLAARAGGVPSRLGIARDTLDDVSAMIERGRAADVLVTCGGASVGPRDWTEDALGRAGAEIVFRRVAIRPGKPTFFALLGGRPVFGLPGNPAAALLCFQLFARPLLRRMQGFARAEPETWRCAAQEPLARLAEFTFLARGDVRAEDGRLWFRLGPRQGSMQIHSLVGHRFVALVPPGEGMLPAGDPVEVLAFW